MALRIGERQSNYGCEKHRREADTERERHDSDESWVARED
jgi:hypothetical protein